MDDFIKQFIENAKKNHTSNVKEYKLNSNKESQSNIKINSEPQLYDENAKSVKRIKELGFTIKNYEKKPTRGCLEKFYCQFNEWNFEVKSIFDVDVSEGILDVVNLKNNSTGEVLDFHCDLFCNTTSKERVEIFLDVLHRSTSDVIKDRYGLYYKLPILLSKAGFSVRTVNFEFDLLETKGFIEIDKKCFIRIFRNYADELKLVVTNDSKWDSRSSSRFSRNNEKIGYLFNFKSKDDIDELSSCIKSFIKHIEGEYGFEEEVPILDNKVSKTVFRYKGDFIQSKVIDLQRQINQQHQGKNRYRYVEVSWIPQWDYKTYGENSNSINLYKGLEIYEEFTIRFNEPSEYSIGNKINYSHILLHYNRKIDSKHCTLKIVNRVFDKKLYSELSTYNINDVTPFDEGVYELKGSFSYLSDIIEKFVYGMFKAHEIEI